MSVTLHTSIQRDRETKRCMMNKLGERKVVKGPPHPAIAAASQDKVFFAQMLTHNMFVLFSNRKRHLARAQLHIFRAIKHQNSFENLLCATAHESEKKVNKLQVVRDRKCLLRKLISWRYNCSSENSI